MNKRKEKFYEFKEYYIKSSNLKNEIIPIIKEKILKNFYEKDGVLYISKEDYIFLLKYSIYWYKDFLYVIDKEIIKKSKYLKRICCNMDMLFFFKPFPFINENIKEISLEFDKFAYTYLIKKENSDYFNIGQNENINYENKDNLYFIQNELLKGKKLKDIETYKKDSFFTIDFWLFRGWNEEESKKKISDIQKKLSIKCKKKKKNNPEIYNKSDTTKIEYWLSKGYSLDDAKIKLKERQCTFSKKKCIEKYGLEEGLKKLKERNKKWQDSLKGREDYVEILIKRQNKKGYSQISQFLFKELEEKIKDLNLKVYYAEKNHEWGIGVKNRGGFLYDFVIPEIKYALEFNGERWHPRKEMNEKEWNEWQNPYTKENADEVYKKDLYKNKILEERGFIVDIVWYKDYIKNKEEIIKNSYLNIINCYEKYK